LITRVRDPPKEEEEEDDDEDEDDDEKDEIETTNTEDSHTSISSSTKPRKRNPTNRWLTSISGTGFRRYRRRVRLRSRPETPPIIGQADNRSLSNLIDDN
jgi:hypothetical protein